MVSMHGAVHVAACMAGCLFTNDIREHCWSPASVSWLWSHWSESLPRQSSNVCDCAAHSKQDRASLRTCTCHHRPSTRSAIQRQSSAVREWSRFGVTSNSLHDVQQCTAWSHLHDPHNWPRSGGMRRRRQCSDGNRNQARSLEGCHV
jgi:hypothetical protein